MGLGTKNINNNNIFNDQYAGHDIHNIDNSLYVENKFYITMLKDEEREFVVTHNANIKPVSYFIGREVELKELRQRIEEKRKSVLVSGMGGIGKTHICRKLFEECVEKHSHNENVPFHHIGYVEYSGDMNNDLLNCLKYKQQEDPKLNQEAAWRELAHLASNGKLLLFVDNVNRPMREDPGLERLKSIPGAIVLTFRRTAFSKEFEPYMIGFLNTEQCREIYEKIRFKSSGRKIKDEELSDLEYIIEKLAARHTITIEFLASLARTKLWSVERLKKELEQNGFKLEYKNEEDELVNIQESYETLYKLSELTEAEQNILEAFSIFPYIPLSAEICNQWLLVDAGVSEDGDILIGLYQKGWLQFNWEQESYAMHPVFAQFIYEKCKPKMEKHAGLITACENYLEIPDSGAPLECQKFIPFGENIVGKIDIGQFLEPVGLESRLATLYLYIAEYKKAEKIFKSLRDVEKNNLDVAVIHNNLAMVYMGQGEYKKAEESFERSLQIWESVLGENNSNTAIGYNNLALVYVKQGEYGKAEELFKKSMYLKESILGKNHLDTANSYNNLAQVYTHCGEYEKSRELQDKSLQIWKSVLGENHPTTAKGYNNLAVLYEKQGEYGKAEELFKKSLYIRESVLGKNHPDTAMGYNNLANLYRTQGEYEKAEEMLEKSLFICKSMLGENHPDIALNYNNFAVLYEKQGEYGKAEELFKKSLYIRESVLGKNHPDTAIGYNNLADLYKEQGEYGKAEKLFEKSLLICKSVLGDNHPLTAKVYNNFAMVYAKQGEYRKAEELYEKSIRIRVSILGESHPDTATSYNDLAMMYQEQGEYIIAFDYYLKAYKVYVSKLGLSHPDSQTIRNNINLLYTKWDTKSDFDQWLQEKMQEGE